ncbi:unnamed protein product, partial [Mesorhabditis belari]|uniref:Uncharacterized protein n=1 Tax=Mesorhabditis belari TaxID=2138241 RepID=A0AAF3EHR5_9BILA
MRSGSTVLDSIAPKAASKGPTAEKENNVPIGYQQTNKIMVQQIDNLRLEVANGKDKQAPETLKVVPRSVKRKAAVELETPRLAAGKANEQMLPPGTPLDFPNPLIETDTVRRRRQATGRPAESP